MGGEFLEICVSVDKSRTCIMLSAWSKSYLMSELDIKTE